MNLRFILPGLTRKGGVNRSTQVAKRPCPPLAIHRGGLHLPVPATKRPGQAESDYERGFAMGYYCGCAHGHDYAVVDAGLKNLLTGREAITQTRDQAS